ncbi:histone [Bradyrhizobium sp. RDM4]|uniref:histone n=1 Tax=Bradyrhizobium sp. RDM4 TaxID=3378765 RepID=UPI0038FC983D
MAAEAFKPDPDAVAGTTNEQVYIPEATDAAVVSPPIVSRKKKRAPVRASKAVAASKTKKAVPPAKKASKKTGKKAMEKTSPKKSAKSPSKKAAKRSKKSKRV